jgi:uncharacterized protein YdeI (YjbR/CyaY-like superfamily)
MSKPNKQLSTVSAKGRYEWRDWLEKNHATSLGVRLIYYKKGSGKASVSYEEAVEEALSNSSKKIIVRWIEGAKRPETRKRRIEKTVNLATENKKPYP